MEDEWQWVLSHLVHDLTECRVEYRMLAVRWEVAYCAAEYDGWLIQSLEDAMRNVGDYMDQLQSDINVVSDILDRIESQKEGGNHESSSR